MHMIINHFYRTISYTNKSNEHQYLYDGDNLDLHVIVEYYMKGYILTDFYIVVMSNKNYN